MVWFHWSEHAGVLVWNAADKRTHDKYKCPVLFCCHSVWCGDQNSSQKKKKKKSASVLPFLAFIVNRVSTEAHSDSCWFSQKFIIIDPFLVLNCKDKLFLFHPGCCGNLVVPNRTRGGGAFFRIRYFTDHDSFIGAHWATRGRGATMYSSSWSCAFLPGALAIPPAPSCAPLLRQLRAPRCARLSAPLGAAASVDT